MAPVALRPYQQEAREAVEADWASGYLRTLLVLPTGCGKTIVFCKVIEDMVREGRRCLILAHRGELLEQAADKLLGATGLRCAIEKAEDTCLDSWYRVTVGSIQSLMREKRLSQFPPDYFDVIVVDEAHHCLSDSYQRVLEHFGAARVLGVTATPDRGDMRNLGQYFQHLAYEYTLPRAIREKYLCPIKAVTIPLETGPDRRGRPGGGLQDFRHRHSPGPLSVPDRRGDETLLRGAEDRRVSPSGKDLPEVPRHPQQPGLPGGGGQRRERRPGPGPAGVQRGAIQRPVQLHAPDGGVGLSLGGLRGGAAARKIRSLYSQMVGRGTRLFPGKEDLLLLDFLWHTERHELCHPANLICESEEVARRMTENIEAAGCPVDIEEAEEKAAADVVAQREKALAKQLAEMRSRKRKLVDPLQFEMSIQAEDLAGYVPSFGWEMAPPSAVQTQTLEKLGIFPDAIECAGKAALLLDRLAKRRAEGLTTPKQIRFLEGGASGMWGSGGSRRPKA